MFIYIYCVCQRLGLGGVVAVCGECYNLGKIDRSVVFVPFPPLPLYFVFENSKNTRNDLAHPVMGTIFLV